MRLTAIDREVVEGMFLNLPGAFMPMRTRLDSPHRNGENWDQIFDQRNPQRGTTPINPGLVADNPSLRFMAQLHLAGRPRIGGRFRYNPGAGAPNGRVGGSWQR